MLGAMMGNSRQNLDIFRPIILPVAVYVMRDLPLYQSASQLFLRNKPMLICIAANVGQMMFHTDADQHVAV